MKRWAAIFFAVVPLTACMTTTAPPSDSIQKIADDVWRYQLAESIELQQKFGVPVRHLPDVTFAQAQRDADFSRAILRRLDAVQPANEDERLTAGVVRWLAEGAIEEPQLFWYRSPVTPYRTPLFTVHKVLAQMKDEEKTPLLAEMPHLVDDILGVLREQERRGIRVPKDEIPAVRGMLDGLAKSLSPEIARLRAHFDDAYFAEAPAGVGLSQYPGGAEAYRAFVRQETTTRLTPEQIHELGLREIARIDGELEAIRQEVGFHGSLADFRRSLKTDPRFFAKTPEEVGERLMAPVHRIEAQVPRFFAHTPKAPYGVKRLAPEFEGGATFGYYQVPTPAEPTGTYISTARS